MSTCTNGYLIAEHLRGNCSPREWLLFHVEGDDDGQRGQRHCEPERGLEPVLVCVYDLLTDCRLQLFEVLQRLADLLYNLRDRR